MIEYFIVFCGLKEDFLGCTPFIYDDNDPLYKVKAAVPYEVPLKLLNKNRLMTSPPREVVGSHEACRGDR